MPHASKRFSVTARDHDTYRGASVMVTGHTGFKGSWLTLWLTRLGARVHGYSLPAPTEPSIVEAANLSSVLASETIADARDRSRLTRAIREARPDFIFHLAAQPHVVESYEDPVSTIEANVMGTVNVLEAVRTLGRPGDRDHVHARRSFDALPSGGRIFVHEIPLGDDKAGPLHATSFSMCLLWATEDKQYSIAELEGILVEAGFTGVTVTPTYGYYVVVSATRP